jgi:hypothetical protein
MLQYDCQASRRWPHNRSLPRRMPAGTYRLKITFSALTELYLEEDVDLVILRPLRNRTIPQRICAFFSRSLQFFHIKRKSGAFSRH